MLLRDIVFKGWHEYEKANNLFPIRWKAHHITELFLELCPRMELDGSTNLNISHPKKKRNHEKKYVRDDYFNVTTYYLEEEQMKALELLTLEEAEEYIVELLEEVLIDIVNRYDKNEEKIRIIKDTIKKMREKNFSLEKKIKKLTKVTKDRKYKAEVFRCLNKKVGEAWYVKISSLGKNKISKIKWITDKPCYLNRTGKFRKSKWEGTKFIITNRLGEEVIGIDINNLELDLEDETNDTYDKNKIDKEKIERRMKLKEKVDLTKAKHQMEEIKA
ncbi:hypothetical protein, partial [Defluviitalea phaphyphila]|uniref:hypothetical protein n=1 Tax=Defluviitalea phaphyphila TaxID=1473580 RepID=UPI00073133BB